MPLGDPAGRHALAGRARRLQPVVDLLVEEHVAVPVAQAGLGKRLGGAWDGAREKVMGVRHVRSHGVETDTFLWTDTSENRNKSSAENVSRIGHILIHI